MSTPRRWRKSSRSNTQTSCVEINHSKIGFGVRDSKVFPSPALEISPERGQVFLSIVKAGQLCRP